MTALSQSILWQQMQSYYDEMGPEIWEDEVVPSQITSNTYLASLYTRLIIAQINDYLASVANKPAGTVHEPFYIIEIGAGHGKYSFYMLQALREALALYKLPEHTIRYVMTDISEKSISSWIKHPALQQFIQNNMLDFAFYNALTDDTLDLKLANKAIKAGQLHKPVFVICNYIFDTLPHDAFQVVKDKLYESEIVISLQNADKIESIFEDNQYDFKHHLISENYYKQDPSLNKILAYYTKYFDDASFLMPIGAIQAMNKLKRFSSAPTMILSADKGTSSLELFDGLENPELTYHGSVSMMVNFDALARYFDFNNGISLLMEDKSADFQVACFITSKNYPILHTQYAFNSALSAFSPQDLFNLAYKDDEPNTAFASLDELLAVVNLSDWDPNIFYDYHPQILACAEKNDITIAQSLSIKHGVDKVWARFFKLEKEQDMAYAIATLLYTIDEPEKALVFYQHSLEQFGVQEETLYNMAVTYQVLDDIPNAVKYAEKSLDFNSEYKEAKNLLKELLVTS